MSHREAPTQLPPHKKPPVGPPFTYLAVFVFCVETAVHLLHNQDLRARGLRYHHEHAHPRLHRRLVLPLRPPHPAPRCVACIRECQVFVALKDCWNSTSLLPIGSTGCPVLADIFSSPSLPCRVRRPGDRVPLHRVPDQEENARCAVLHVHQGPLNLDTMSGSVKAI